MKKNTLKKTLIVGVMTLSILGTGIMICGGGSQVDPPVALSNSGMNSVDPPVAKF